MVSEIPDLKEVERAKKKLILRYSDSKEYNVSYHQLRIACPCASCSPKRDEKETYEEFKKLTTSFKHEKPSVTPVGNYALSFSWSVGCSSGIYTFERLYKLAKGKDPDDGKPYTHGVW